MVFSFTPARQVSRTGLPTDASTRALRTAPPASRRAAAPTRLRHRGGRHCPPGPGPHPDTGIILCVWQPPQDLDPRRVTQAGLSLPCASHGCPGCRRLWQLGRGKTPRRGSPGRPKCLQADPGATLTGPNCSQLVACLESLQLARQQNVGASRKPCNLDVTQPPGSASPLQAPQTV